MRNRQRIDVRIALWYNTTWESADMKQKQKRFGRVTSPFYMKTQDWEAIRLIADARDITISQVLREAVALYLKIKRERQDDHEPDSTRYSAS